MERIGKSRVARVNKKRRRKWIWRSVASLFVLILVISAYFFYQTWGVLAGTYEPLARDHSKKRDKAVSVDSPVNILLLGTDVRRESENWRPDVIILAAVNPKTHSIKVVSIPRDTYVEIANTNGHKDKINSAAAWARARNVGPVLNTVETVENFLNVPVDYYAKVNFKGFMDVVDALGGVDVNVKFPFHQETFGGEVIRFNPGPHHLDGEEALAYVRMRKQDPLGDQGRNLRQREVVTQLIDKIVSFDNITKVNTILKSLGENVSTSITVDEMITLQKIYRDIPKKNIQTITIKGENKRLKYWYFFVSKEERQRISDILRKQLELKPEKIPGPDPTEGMLDDSSSDGDEQQDGSLGDGSDSYDQSGGSDY
jgi:polyisoprenyl-teichoic acid--peptidoglycan teichoic acid transferase